LNQRLGLRDHSYENDLSPVQLRIRTRAIPYRL